jgi:tetratricopeptide (TPR) repeat protein
VLGASFLSSASNLCAINGEGNTELRAQILYQLGSCYDRAGKRAEALKAYNQVLALSEAGDYKKLAKAGIDAPAKSYTNLK